jgi:Fur family ferric uptake transcriptional regulator
MSAHPNQVVEARLTRSGDRYTRGRRDLVTILCDAEGPLTIDDLARRGARLSKSSLYRNLAVLTAAGVVREVMATDGLLRFELCETIAGHHHHLVCTRCGVVLDYRPPTSLETAVDAARAAVTDTTGFVTTSHRVDLEGLCARCAAPS